MVLYAHMSRIGGTTHHIKSLEIFGQNLYLVSYPNIFFYEEEIQMKIMKF